MSMANSLLAEWAKLRTLPAVVVTSIATIAVGAAVAAALARSSAGTGASAAVIAVGAVPFLQVGFVLLGILTATQEYAGRQIHSTLMGTPRRGFVAASKAMAVTTAATGLAAISLLTSWLVGIAIGHAAADQTNHLLGACLYLVLLCLVAHGVALLARSLIVALVAVLGLVMIVSPLLAGLTEHARWLPDQAGRLLYGATDPLLAGWAGGLLMAAWAGLALVAGFIRFARNDG